MTAIPRLRGEGAQRAPAVLPGLRAVRFLLVPAVIGWLLFVALDGFPGLLPQEIRISQSATRDGVAWAEYDPYFDDFVVFYAAGNLARSGNDSVYELTDIHLEQSRLLETDPREVIRLPFFNPPQYLAPLALLSLLPMGAAAVLWTAAGLVAFVAALAWLFRRRSGPLQLMALATAALVISMPFHEVILHGQMTLVLFAALVAFYAGTFASEEKRDWLTAASLTVLALKPQLVAVPLLYLLVTRQFGPILRFALLEAGLTLGAASAYGFDIYGQWLGLVVNALGWEDGNGVWIHAMFGWNAFVRALIGTGHAEIRAAFSIALSLGTVAFVVISWRRVNSLSAPRTFATIVFAGILLSPHLFAQDLLLVGTAVLVLLLTGNERSRVVWTIYGVVGWMLTFWHFGLLLPDSSEQGLNLVTLWLAAGLAMAALPWRPGFRPFRPRSCPAVRAAEELV